jgi:hypothetical protein
MINVMNPASIVVSSSSMSIAMLKRSGQEQGKIRLDGLKTTTSRQAEMAKVVELEIFTARATICVY